MNNNWKAFEEKRKALHTKYCKMKWRNRIIWLCFNVVVDFLIFSFINQSRLPLAVVLCMISTILSTVYMIKSINELKKIEAEQDLILMNDAPIGKIKL